MAVARPRPSSSTAVVEAGAPLPAFRLDNSDAASRLRLHARHEAGTTLRAHFAKDARRFTHFSCKADGFLLDYAKERLSATALADLLALADEARLADGIAAMLSGQPVNFTEGRAALHTAARLFDRSPFSARTDSAATLARMRAFAARLHDGHVRGSTGRPFRHVIHLGIGGSDLGPRLLAEAFASTQSQRLTLSFAANIDETELQAILRLADPAECLFIVASKSFSTSETLSNARLARMWLGAALGDAADLSRHFVAISQNVAAANAFGVSADAIFPLPEWIGGRFSVWSAIGLPVMLAFGPDAFDAFLAGGRRMDAHFADAPPAANLPVLMALLGIWNTTFLGADSLAILPYSHRLRSLPAYLQQLEMESNGKSVDREGRPVTWSTAPIVFGGAGTVGQHAYHQLFYQGSRKLALEFIVPVPRNPSAATRCLLGNALAQSAALMKGHDLHSAEAELRALGVDETQVARLAPHRVCAGNQPSSTLLMPEVTPFSLGQLLALYEHKVFVQGWIWGINSFDQYGVMLGKAMAQRIDATAGIAHDDSTRGLLAAIDAMTADDACGQAPARPT